MKKAMLVKIKNNNKKKIKKEVKMLKPISDDFIDNLKWFETSSYNYDIDKNNMRAIRVF